MYLYITTILCDNKYLNYDNNIIAVWHASVKQARQLLCQDD